MKFLIFALFTCGILGLSNWLHGTEHIAVNKSDTQSSAISADHHKLFSQLDTLEIVTLFLTYDPIDQTAVNRGMAKSFQKMGALTTSQEPSFLQTLLESPPKDAICSIMMEKTGEGVEVRICFIREDPTDPNAICLPIWDKSLHQKCIKGQEEQTIVRLAAQLMKQIIEMRAQANDGSKKELKMHMRQCASF